MAQQLDNKKLELKTPAMVALSAMFVLFVAGCVFYKERLLFPDASYILSNIINNRSLAIQEHRYGSFVTQIVPYVGLLLHWPLKLLMIGYAASFNLFYLAICTLLVFKLRQYGLAIVMALYYTILVGSSWCWISNEIQQAVAWMFLFYAIVLSTETGKVLRPAFLMAFTLLAMVTIFTHFIVIIPMVFLWTYFWIEQKRWPFSGKLSGLFSVILIICIGFKYIVSANQQSYDSTHLHGVTHFSLKDVLSSFSTPVVALFMHRCATIYWPVMILSLAGLCSLAIARSWKLLGFVMVSAVGYIVIMGLTYGDDNGTMQLFHIESEWQCIGIIVATPFVYSFLPQLSGRVSAILLIAFFTVRFFYIGSSIPQFMNRTALQRKMLYRMEELHISKLVLYDDIPEVRAQYLLFWGAPNESMFASGIAGDQPQKVFCFVNRDDTATLHALTANKYYTGFGVAPIASLNRRYFTIDSTHAYSVMSYEDFFK